MRSDLQDLENQAADKVRDLDWDRVGSDVRPFLEDAREIDLITRENVLDLLTG